MVLSPCALVTSQWWPRTLFLVSVLFCCSGFIEIYFTDKTVHIYLFICTYLKWFNMIHFSVINKCPTSRGDLFLLCVCVCVWWKLLRSTFLAISSTPYILLTISTKLYIRSCELILKLKVFTFWPTPPHFSHIHTPQLQPLGTTVRLSVSMSLTFFFFLTDFVYKWSHTVFVFLCLALFT